MRPPPGTDNNDNFVIHGGGNDFANRQRQIFEHLSQAAREWKKDHDDSCPSTMELSTIDARGGPTRSPGPRPRAGLKRAETRQYRGKESIFKRPEGPAPLAVRKIIPDHHKNPHKWVKYSLEDVRSEQMSDRSNAQAAFSFLKELRARRKRESCEGESEELMDTDEPKPDGDVQVARGCKFTARVQFRKSIENKDGKEPPVVIVERDERPVFRNSKIILPEYVVGQKAERRTKKNRPVVKIDRSKQLKLSHLDEPDE